MRDLVLSVDYSQKWPLSDFMWFEEERPDWDSLIDDQLKQRLIAWAVFFNENADEVSRSFGSEDKRRWFDLEGSALLGLVDDAVGHLYKVKLHLWF